MSHSFPPNANNSEGIINSIRSGMSSPYYDKKITKFEFTYNADKDVETLKAYQNSTLLFTLTFGYDVEKNITSIVRS